MVEETRVAGSAALSLVTAATPLRPEPGLFEAMLAGWRRQQQSRGGCAARCPGPTCGSSGDVGALEAKYLRLLSADANSLRISANEDVEDDPNQQVAQTIPINIIYLHFPGPGSEMNDTIP